MVRETTCQVPEDELGERYERVVDEKDLPRAFLASVVTSEYRYYPDASE